MLAERLWTIAGGVLLCCLDLAASLKRAGHKLSCPSGTTCCSIRVCCCLLELVAEVEATCQRWRAAAESSIQQPVV